MKQLHCLLILTLFISLSLKAQHTIQMDVFLNVETNTLKIEESLNYVNASKDTLNELVLTDWAHSFSNKTTPLAVRFAENFSSAFHFEKEENRGRTKLSKLGTSNNDSLSWQRSPAPDLIKVTLPEALAPGESINVTLSYETKVPNDKFTRFGVSKNGDYKLRYWFMAPAVYDGGWQAYSNKNTDDFYMDPSTFHINFHIPNGYQLITDLDVTGTVSQADEKVYHLQGNQRMSAPIYLDKTLGFQSVVTDQLEVITDIKDKKVTPAIKALQIDRITRFLETKLGKYPFSKLVVSDADYRNSPVYGLNQLPDFISPFPSGFEMDLALMKTISRKYVENTLSIHPRNDYWLIGALQVYLMIAYVNTYYPDIKILGNMSEFFIVRWSHASELEFNDQYPFLYLNMARSNLHQALVTPKDSLVKFNKELANDYYAGSGLVYLKDYLGEETLEKSIKEFFDSYQLQKARPSDFQEILQKNTPLPVNWFFEDYAGKRTLIDFKIKNVTIVGDSLKVTVQNKRNNSMPVALYGLNRDEIVFKKWLPPVDSTTTLMVPREGIRKLAVNYEGTIPEFNQRNNFKKVEGLLNRPLQFRLFQDIEDPKYNQVFFMPTFSYNLYDGFTLGPKVYNKTLLPKGFYYRLEPQYGFNSQTLVGKGALIFTDRKYYGDLYYVRYGLSGTYYSYDDGLFYKKFSPYITMAFRDHHDLRKNKRQFVNVRSVSVSRDENPNNPNQEPNYSVYNLQYVYSDNNLINFYRASFDFELAKKFSKLACQLEYRKLFLSNRQINLRFFTGLFLYNNTDKNDDYFSFALDRPTDYMFDYNYYGRSENSGLFSQQLIVAEGGFKSQLEPSFANEWIISLNASTNIWKWIYAYGDVGVVKNSNFNGQLAYDSGIRASLVADYFEIYFPLYSNLGWEPGLGNYDQRIRFIVTLDIRTLTGLFTRKWY
ncbi:MAG TPA: metalloprotease [Flavobacteriaceae bacterium]|nr:metalloprotease [Flavobacteriaceae bacterium]MCB9212593.1 metalloprotease [Alteromonas sp.]HPF10661.1 metalloprotease [Flavobacteriaceae bacterium]HQU20943.1 metalloprotease [Flavobacteriaceae bacterium]HQU64427.1 metalloprotease [Flavobacteriaceae bacterium]